MATGTVPAGTTGAPLPTGQYGWRVWVDTRSSGFLPGSDAPDPGTGALPQPKPDEVPVYLVRIGDQSAADALRFLSGSPVVDGGAAAAMEARTAGNTALGAALAAANGPIVTLSSVGPSGFMLTVEYPAANESSGLSATPLSVEWIGVEQRRRPVPVSDQPAQTDQPVKTEAVTVTQIPDRPALPWPTFQNGQRLTPTDLNAVQSTVRALLWLHNRTLHDWGVAEGYEVTPTQNQRGVRVAPGTALDMGGHELMLNDQVELQLPPQDPQTGPDESTDWWVTVTYRDGLVPQVTDPSCRPEGVPQSRVPQAAVRWRNPNETDPAARPVLGTDIVLATVTVVQGLVTQVTAVGRRSAVPPRRPYIAAGRTPNPVDVPTDGTPTGPIDTSSGAFVNTPQYFITIETESKNDPGVVDLMAAPVVVGATSSHFKVQLLAAPEVDTPAPARRWWWWGGSMLGAAGAVTGALIEGNRGADEGSSLSALIVSGVGALMAIGFGLRAMLTPGTAAPKPGRPVQRSNTRRRWVWWGVSMLSALGASAADLIVQHPLANSIVSGAGALMAVGFGIPAMLDRGDRQPRAASAGKVTVAWVGVEM
jgi:hypothetical protein